jgi:uracil-DNA glycosylase family 4
MRRRRDNPADSVGSLAGEYAVTRVAKPDACRDCVGYGWTHDHAGFSLDEGHGTIPLLICGEALGASEENDALPFRPYAEAGSLLEKAIRVAGYSRAQFRLTNAIRCRPPKDWLAGAPWEFEALRHCRPYLDKSIADARPRCIFAVGGIALRELTGFAGPKQGVSYLRGYALDGPQGIPVIGTPHTAFLRRGAIHLFGVLIHDLQQAVAVARNGRPAPIDTRYLTHPSLDDALSFFQRAMSACGDSSWLTYDIETPDSANMDEDERDDDPSMTITQIQFSLASGEGIVFPGEPAYLDIARRIMSIEPLRKAGHFCHLFDDPRLLANGFRLHRPTWDTYEMWHTMQPDLPANLQYVASFYGMDAPWKHLAASDMLFYGACDVDAPQRILAKLPADMAARGVWDSYLRRVHSLRPILTAMSERGIPVNDGRRIAFGSELEAAMRVEYEDMQALVPEESRNVHPKQGYKKAPKDLTGLVERNFDVDGLDPSKTTVSRWCRIEPFVPSPKQLLRYMRHRGHSVPRDFKTDNETTAAKELERLSRKTDDPLYRRVISYRELQKMKGTYVDGWKPAADGRVHTTFTFAPATAQLSSRSPNTQNWPVHEKEGRPTGLADKFLRCLEAPAGYRWLIFDHKSFHMLTMAYLADDTDLERISRIDVHAFLTSQYLKLKPAEAVFDMADDELRDYLKRVKREHKLVRETKAKRTSLAWIFGQQYRSLYNLYRESFTSERDAKLIYDTLEGLFPRTVAYRLRIRHEADRRNFLISPFGFLRWFWDVIDWRPPRSGSAKKCAHCGQHHGWGGQSEQAIAFLPANLAFGMMRDEMRAFDERGLAERYAMNNNVHDAHYFLCADELVEEAIHTIKPIMEAPSPCLVNVSHPAGLWCATSVSVGRNLAPQSESNPDGKEEVNVGAHQPALA